MNTCGKGSDPILLLSMWIHIIFFVRHLLLRIYVFSTVLVFQFISVYENVFLISITYPLQNRQCLSSLISPSFCTFTSLFLPLSIYNSIDSTFTTKSRSKPPFPFIVPTEKSRDKKDSKRTTFKKNYFRLFDSCSHV